MDEQTQDTWLVRGVEVGKPMSAFLAQCTVLHFFRVVLFLAWVNRSWSLRRMRSIDPVMRS